MTSSVRGSPTARRHSPPAADTVRVDRDRRRARSRDRPDRGAQVLRELSTPTTPVRSSGEDDDHPGHGHSRRQRRLHRQPPRTSATTCPRRARRPAGRRSSRSRGRPRSAESCRPAAIAASLERAGEQVGDGLASKALLDLERRADLCELQGDAGSPRHRRGRGRSDRDRSPRTAADDRRRPGRPGPARIAAHRSHRPRRVSASRRFHPVTPPAITRWM